VVTSTCRSRGSLANLDLRTTEEKRKRSEQKYFTRGKKPSSQGKGEQLGPREKKGGHRGGQSAAGSCRNGDAKTGRAKRSMGATVTGCVERFEEKKDRAASTFFTRKAGKAIERRKKEKTKKSGKTPTIKGRTRVSYINILGLRKERGEGLGLLGGTWEIVKVRQGREKWMGSISRRS